MPGSARRRAPTVALLGLLALSACGGGGFFGEDSETPLPGNRIAILTADEVIKPDAEFESVPVVLPPPYLNPAWSQPGGNDGFRESSDSARTPLSRGRCLKDTARRQGHLSCTFARLSSYLGSSPLVSARRQCRLSCIHIFCTHPCREAFASRTRSPAARPVVLHALTSLRLPRFLLGAARRKCQLSSIHRFWTK